jgi:exosortase B
MSTVLEQRALPRSGRRWGPWLAVVAALAVLYVPTYIDLARGAWRDDAYAHGPIVLAVFAWLAWRAREALLAPARPQAAAGFALLFAGLFLYVIGRTIALTVFEVASHLPVIAGVLLLAAGWHAVRALGFALLFLFFLIPLPGFILDLATTPLKEIVSAAVEMLLQAAGYPVERSGVVLEVGRHQMLVADACSGLNSLYSLFALGLVYLHLTEPRSGLRWALALAAIVPIAIVANVVRVLILVLVTHHLGEEAAQSFLHGFAGMVVFVTALLLFLGADALIRRHIARTSRAPVEAKPAAGKSPLEGVARWSAPLLLAVAAITGAAVAAPLLKPAPSNATIGLEEMIPARFGEWQLDPEMVPLAPAPDVQANLDRIYREIVNRTYVNAAGERVMLTVAYGGDQSDALKAHRQESCYAAQGFEIHGLAHGRLALDKGAIPVTRMVAVRGERVEPVTYWLTMGDRVVLSRAERLKVQLASGLAGRIPDGMLVRVSTIGDDAARAFPQHRSFVAALLAAMPAAEAARLVGRHQEP